MLIDIDEAPFTEEEKITIKGMGIFHAYWGHPNIVLANPVEYFRCKLESIKINPINLPQEKPDYSKPFQVVDENYRLPEDKGVSVTMDLGQKLVDAVNKHIDQVLAGEIDGDLDKIGMLISKDDKKRLDLLDALKADH